VGYWTKHSIFRRRLYLFQKAPAAFRCLSRKLRSVADRGIHPSVAAEVLLLAEGHMIKYKKLGFKSLEEYTEHFFVTLLPSNKTYEYLVDWNKVKKGIHKYLWRGTCLIFC